MLTTIQLDQLERWKILCNRNDEAKAVEQIMPERLSSWVQNSIIKTSLVYSIGAKIGSYEIPNNAGWLFAIANQRGQLHVGLVERRSSFESNQQVLVPILNEKALKLTNFETSMGCDQVLTLHIEPLSIRTPHSYNLWIYTRSQSSVYRRYHAAIVLRFYDDRDPSIEDTVDVRVFDIVGLSQKYQEIDEPSIFSELSFVEIESTHIDQWFKIARNYSVADPEFKFEDKLNNERPVDLLWRRKTEWAWASGRKVESKSISRTIELPTAPLCVCSTEKLVITGCADGNLYWQTADHPELNVQSLDKMVMAIDPLITNHSNVLPALLVLLQSGELSILVWRKKQIATLWQHYSSQFQCNAIEQLSSVKGNPAFQRSMLQVALECTDWRTNEQTAHELVDAFCGVTRGIRDPIINKVLDELNKKLAGNGVHTSSLPILVFVAQLLKYRALNRQQLHSTKLLLPKLLEHAQHYPALPSVVTSMLEELDTRLPLVTTNDSTAQNKPHNLFSVWANLYDVTYTEPPRPLAKKVNSPEHRSHGWALFQYGNQLIAPCIQKQSMQLQGFEIHADKPWQVVSSSTKTAIDVHGTCFSVVNTASNKSAKALIASFNSRDNRLSLFHINGSNNIKATLFYESPKIEFVPLVLKIVTFPEGSAIVCLARNNEGSSLHAILVDTLGVQVSMFSTPLTRGDESLLDAAWKDEGLICAIASRAPGPVQIHRLNEANQCFDQPIQLMALSSGCCSLCFLSDILFAGEYNGLIYRLNLEPDSKLASAWSYQLSQSAIRLIPMQDEEHGFCVLALTAGHNTTLLEGRTGLRVWHRHWRQPIDSIQSDGSNWLLVMFADGHIQLLHRGSRELRTQSLAMGLMAAQNCVSEPQPSANAFASWCGGGWPDTIGRKTGARIARWLAENWSIDCVKRLQEVAKCWDQRAAVIFINQLLARYISDPTIPAGRDALSILTEHEPKQLVHAENINGNYYEHCLRVLRLRLAAACEGQLGLKRQLRFDGSCYGDQFDWLQLEARRLMAESANQNAHGVELIGLDAIDQLPDWYFRYQPPAYRLDSEPDRLSRALAYLLQKPKQIAQSQHNPLLHDELVELVDTLTSRTDIELIIGHCAQWLLAWRDARVGGRSGWRVRRQPLLNPLLALNKLGPGSNQQIQSLSAQLHRRLYELLGKAVPTQLMTLEDREARSGAQLRAIRRLLATSPPLKSNLFEDFCNALAVEAKRFQEFELEAYVRGTRLHMAPPIATPGVDGGAEFVFEPSVDAVEASTYVDNVDIELELFDSGSLSQRRRSLDNHHQRVTRLQRGLSLPPVTLAADSQTRNAVLTIRLTAPGRGDDDCLWYEERKIAIATHERFDVQGLLRNFNQRTKKTLQQMIEVSPGLCLVELPPALPKQAVSEAIGTLGGNCIDLDSLWRDTPDYARPLIPERVFSHVAETNIDGPLVLMPANRLVQEWLHDRSRDDLWLYFLDEISNQRFCTNQPVLVCVGPTAFRCALRARPTLRWRSWYRLPSEPGLRAETEMAVAAALDDAGASEISPHVIVEELDYLPELVLHFIQTLRAHPEQASRALTMTLEHPKHHEWICEELTAVGTRDSALALSLSNVTSQLPLQHISTGMRLAKDMHSQPGKPANVPKLLVAAGTPIKLESIERSRGALGANHTVAVHGVLVRNWIRSLDENDAVSRALSQIDQQTAADCRKKLIAHGLVTERNGIVALVWPLEKALAQNIVGPDNRQNSLLLQLRKLLGADFNVVELLDLSEGELTQPRVDLIPLRFLWPNYEPLDYQQLRHLILLNSSVPSVAEAAARPLFESFGEWRSISLSSDELTDVLSQEELLEIQKNLSGISCWTLLQGNSQEPNLLDPRGEGNEQLLIGLVTAPPYDVVSANSSLRRIRSILDRSECLPIALAGSNARRLLSAASGFVHLEPGAVFDALPGKSCVRDAIHEAIVDQLPLSALRVFQLVNSLPQDSNLFVGRESELEYLSNHVDHQHMLIVGPRRIGKTSLILRFRHNLIHQRNCRTLYVDVQGVGSLNGLGAALKTAAKTEYPEVELVDTNDLDAVLSSLGQHAKNDECRLVVLLNEVDELMSNEMGLGTVLRRVTENYPPIRLVMTGYGTVALLRDQSHPLYNFVQGRDFNQRAILPRPISSDDAGILFDLLERRPLDLRWDPKIDKSIAYKQLYESAEGIPWAVQVAASDIVKLVESKRPRVIQQLELEVACERIQRNLWQYLDDFIESRGTGTSNADPSLALVSTIDRSLLRAALTAMVLERYLSPYPARLINTPNTSAPLIIKIGLSNQPLFHPPKADDYHVIQHAVTSFNPQDCWSSLERFAERALFSNEIDRLRNYWINMDVRRTFDFACLGLLLEPDPYTDGRYGFPRHLYPRLLYRRLQSFDLKGENHLVGIIAELVDKLPRK